MERDSVWRLHPVRKSRVRGAAGAGSRESLERPKGRAGGANRQDNPKGVRGMQEAREVVGDESRRRGANPQGRNVPEVVTPGDTGTRHEAPKGREPQERQAFDLAVDARGKLPHPRGVEEDSEAFARKKAGCSRDRRGNSRKA